MSRGIGIPVGLVLMLTLILTLPLALIPVGPLGAQGGVTSGVVSRDSAILTRVAQSGIVHGVVRDSLHGAPLANAIVQLVATNAPTPFGRSVETDAEGRYRFADVPVGRYTVGFQHPRLDSLGLEPPVHGVEVGDISDVRADLAIPSARRLRESVCGSSGAPPTSGTMLMGFVRHAISQAGIRGARIDAEWIELQLDRNGFGHRLRRRTVTTSDNGWFVFCDVPSRGNVAVRVVAGADSLDPVEFEMAGNPVEQRELLMGPSRVLTFTDTVKSGDSLVVRPRMQRVGDGALHGAVIRADNGRPLANAQVTIMNGPSTRTNARGEWVLADVPQGTRTVDVRAVGYFPTRLVVQVQDVSDTPLIALSTTRQVLATMTVRADYQRFTDMRSFRERMRNGNGRYLTARDVAARGPLLTSDLFKSVPGVYLDYVNGEKYITVRGMGDHHCAPTVILNGAPLEGLDASLIDTFIVPERILGIEVYQAGVVPVQFQNAMSGCGALVFWTR